MHKLKGVYRFFRDIHQGVRSVARWFPIIWRDRDWDWAFLAEIMERKITWIAEHEEKFGHHTTSLRDAKQQRLCAALLRRMLADKYHVNARIFAPGDAFKHADMMAKQDLALFGKVLGKHMRNWWD